MKTWLIARAKMEERDYKRGIDSIINLDYMGASEYEWGAMPESLKQIRDNINQYTYLDVPLYNKIITVFCLSEQKSEIKEYLKKLADGKMNTKMGSYFDRYVKPSEYEIKWQARNPLKTNFWWDIENHLMFWVKSPDFEIKFKEKIAG